MVETRKMIKVLKSQVKILEECIVIVRESCPECDLEGPEKDVAHLKKKLKAHQKRLQTVLVKEKALNSSKKTKRATK